MKLNKTVIKYLLNILSIAIVVFIIINIGFDKVIEHIANTDIKIISLVFLLLTVSLVIRVKKYNILFPDLGFQDIVDLVLFSRLGKEVSAVGYFLPVINMEGKKTNTIKGLLVDRILEVLSTLVLGVAFIAPHLSENLILVYSFIVLFGTIIAIVVVSVVSLDFLKKIKFRRVRLVVDKLLEIHKALASDKKNRLVIFTMSLIATVADFLCMYLIIRNLDSNIDFYYIPFIAAITGIIGFISFVNFGPGEVSTVELLHALANVKRAASMAMILLYRVFVVLHLFFFIIMKNLFFMSGSKKKLRLKKVPVDQ